MIDEVIELAPEEFERYQQAVKQVGMTRIQFDHYFASKAVAETNLAILLRIGQKEAWIPKSVIYNYNDSDATNISLYIRTSFPITWLSIS